MPFLLQPFCNRAAADLLVSEHCTRIHIHMYMYMYIQLIYVKMYTYMYVDTCARENT